MAVRKNWKLSSKIHVQHVMEQEQNRELLRKPVRNVAERSSSIHFSIFLWNSAECTDLSGLSRNRKDYQEKVQIVSNRLCGKQEDYFRYSIPAGIGTNGQASYPRKRRDRRQIGGRRGDLLVEVTVSRHPVFGRQDMHIFSTAPISFAQAALGGDVRIKTVDGDVLYNVKPGAKTDTKDTSERKRSFVSLEINRFEEIIM